VEGQTLFLLGGGGGGGGGGTDSEPMYNLCLFLKNCGLKIRSKSFSRHLVRLHRE